MAYNVDLEDSIEELITGWADTDKRRMFGGIGYLIGGNMGFGIWKDFLVVRTGPEAVESILGQDGIHPFDVTGRPMKGWVMVDGSRWEDPEELARWLKTGRDFALTLPPK
jgi:TfoX/Sxy family transcriptional regulator of competence genes